MVVPGSRSLLRHLCRVSSGPSPLYPQAYPTKHDVMKGHMWWLLSQSFCSWPQLRDLLEFEGGMASAEYFVQLQAVLESCRGDATAVATGDEKGPCSAQKATLRANSTHTDRSVTPTGAGLPVQVRDVDDGSDSPHNQDICKMLREQPPPARPLLALKQAEFRVNEYKRQMRRQHRLHVDSIEPEDFEELGLFEEA